MGVCVREWVVVSGELPFLALLRSMLRSSPVVAVIPLELFTFLVRLPQMVSISPGHHRLPRHRLRKLNLNLRKPILLCTRLVLIIGCPAWMRVRDVDDQGQWRYLTSFQNVYAPRPNSRSHRHHPRPYRNRCDPYHRRHLPHPHNPFRRHQ